MKKSFYILILLATSITPVSAHTGLIVNHTQSLLNGFMHPLAGIDHLLFMFSVGIYASSFNSRLSLWFIALFLVFLTLGAFLENLSVSFFDLESSIVLSLFSTGVLLLSNTKPTRRIVFLFLAYFALCHGNSHAVEMNAGDNADGNITGFLLSTSTILLLGIFAGRFSVTKLDFLRTFTGIVSIAIGTLALAN